MANQLKMATVQSILALHSRGWSGRRIARELGVNRETVSRYMRLAAQAEPVSSTPANAPISLLGSECRSDSIAAPCGGGKPASAPLGGSGADITNPANAPISAPGSAGPATAATVSPSAPAGRRSQCEPWREEIQVKLDQGLSARRIHQDLSADPQFRVGYDSVRRFLKRLGRVRPLPFRRMECAPGEEAQADFGNGAPVITPEGKRKRTHLFRIVLSHSRKAYSESTYRQTTDDFLRVLENAFWHFGGVPKVLVIDNLKAAVKQPDWYDPELVPKVAAFAVHYGVAILPTKPRTPRHKGKTERGIGYGQDNGLKGHTFNSLEAENDHLVHWETHVADMRIHGTTRKQVGKAFREVEQPALQPLPRERFPSFHEAQRIVNRDGHIEVAKAYYSVPPEYVGRDVWARWDARLVRIFNHRLEPIRVHVRQSPGKFATQPEDLHPRKINSLERGAAWLLNKVRLIGPHSHAWAQAMVTARGIEGTRVLMGLISLTKRHDSGALEQACEIALSHGAYRLRVIRQLLKHRAPKQEPLPFLDEHPLIRPLEDYARIVAAAHERETDRRRPSDAGARGDGFLRHGSGVRGGLQPASPDGHNHQGSGAFSTRPRSGYPSSGCSAAEPDSVSPDTSSVIGVPFHSQ